MERLRDMTPHLKPLPRQGSGGWRAHAFRLYREQAEMGRLSAWPRGEREGEESIHF